MGLPEQNLSNIKNKSKINFNLIHVANICRFYNLNANWVIDRNEKKSCLEPRKVVTIHRKKKTLAGVEPDK
jgi:hypothetical protein